MSKKLYTLRNVQDGYCEVLVNDEFIGTVDRKMLIYSIDLENENAKTAERWYACYCNASLLCHTYIGKTIAGYETREEAIDTIVSQYCHDCGVSNAEEE